MSRAPSVQCLSYLRNALSRRPVSCLARRHRSRNSCRSLSNSSTRLARDVENEAPSAWDAVVSSLAKKDRAANSNEPGRLRHHQHKTSLSLEEVRALSPGNFFALLRGYHHSGEFSNVVRAFEAYHPGRSPWRQAVWPPSLNFYIQAHIRLRDNDPLLDGLLRDFQQHPKSSSYDSRTANIMLNYLIVCKKPIEAFNMLEDLHVRRFPLDTVSYNTVLNGARAGSASARQLGQILKLMADRNVPRDTRTINIVVATMCQLKEYKKAHKFLVDACESGLANTTTYNTVISAELVRGNWSSASSLLRDMRDQQIARDEATYAPFLRVLTQQKDTAHVSQLLDLVRDDKIALSAPSFNTLLHGLLFSGDLNQAASLLELMQAQDTTSEATFRTILHFYKGCSTSFLTNPVHQRLLQFVNEQVERHESISEYTSVKILRESQRHWKHQGADRTDSPLNFVEQAEHRTGDLEAATRDIGSSMEQGRWQNALAKYNAVVARGVCPPIQMFISTLVGLLRYRKYREARKITRDMDPKHLRKNLQFQTAMLSVITTQSVTEDIRDNIKFLQSVRVNLDMIFYSAAAWRLYRDNKFHDAVSLLSYVFGLGLAFDLVAWTILVECYAKTRNLGGTIWCLQTMKDNKILLDNQARRRIKRVVKTLESDTNKEDIAIARGLFADLRETRARSLAQEPSTTSKNEVRPTKPIVNGPLQVTRTMLDEDEEAEERISMSHAAHI